LFAPKRDLFLLGEKVGDRLPHFFVVFWITGDLPIQGADLFALLEGVFHPKVASK